ncbi:MAG: fluoride efflux transporter CrcB [Gammaproteobacteria bacterium]|nr:fluoride efflux transporter CrcB [Gammaproteobacteria bacterium]
MMIVAIAIGGALGAVLRYILVGWAQMWGAGFPYGTLLVNVMGSLMAGIVYIVLMEKLALDSAMRGFILVGLLGSLTTFSTFSLETVHLLEAGEFVKAGLNSVISIVTCISATWLGFYAARAWYGNL